MNREHCPNNFLFLQALFGEDCPFVHVTDFRHDPGKIPSDQVLIAWKGDWFSRYKMSSGSNQYFTISIFNPDEKGVARRRKALFMRTRVIVLDDVREKLSIEAVSKMPLPSYILETSPGSEQWGYILAEPCADSARVENLLDGLIANGLSPDGSDPGMKGVTRYVRLPDGHNLKANKFVDGLPFKCRILDWHPERKTTMEDLARPFSVDLDRERRETRTDGAANIPDHPLLQIPDIINIKNIRSEGRFDITCPWVDGHTGQDDSGSAIFTNDDGSIGFRCHHGGCADRSARDLIRHVEGKRPGFGTILANWRAGRVFTEIAKPSFMGVDLARPDADKTVEVSFMGDTAAPPSLDTMFDALRRERHTSPEAREIAARILRIVSDMPAIEQQQLHHEVCDLMHWSKTDFRTILKDLKAEWSNGFTRDSSFLTDIVFVKEQNRFYDYGTRIYYTPEAFQNSFSDQDSEVRKVALELGKVNKVDRLDFAPRMPRIFEQKGIVYGNSWDASHVSAGSPGDASKWLEHWDHLGWGEHRNHHLRWMAYTLRHPEDKINHMLILGGMEGTGKDFILYPLVKALGQYAKVVEGSELLSDHNEYLFSTKLLHINETELGDHKKAKEVSNRLKPIAAAPPDTLRVNPKGVTAVSIRNIVNGVMTTNDRMPVRLNGPSRRFYAAWSNLCVRDRSDNMLPEWVKYWADRWEWMKEGYEHCVHYLVTQVDISGFNPGAAPPMTEFLRDIRDASKSPAASTLETFIAYKIGAMKSDLATANDICTTMRAAQISHNELMNVDAAWFTPVRVGRILGDMYQCRQYRAVSRGHEIRVWAIRDSDKYSEMSVSELYAAYEEGMAAIKEQSILEKTHFKLASSK